MRTTAAFLALALAGCSGGSRPAQAAPLSYAASGLASWYGEEVAGNRTASGERFDPLAITAAHRTLPLGSLVEVTDLASGRAILVRINDRGPGRADRLIDLSSGAAHLLGTDRRPVSTVHVQAVPDGRDGREGWVTAPGNLARETAFRLPSSRSGRYLVQVASFSDEDRARKLAERLGADVVESGGRWRVRLGPLAAQEVQRARDAAAARGYADAQIIAAD